MEHLLCAQYLLLMFSETKEINKTHLSLENLRGQHVYSGLVALAKSRQAQKLMGWKVDPYTVRSRGYFMQEEELI